MIYTTRSSIHLSDKRVSFGNEAKKVELVSYTYGHPYESVIGLPEIVLSGVILKMFVWSPVK